MIDSIILIPLLIEILIGIGIISGVIWIWKKRNWSILKKAAVTITLAAGLLIAFFLLIFVGFNSSYDESTLTSHYSYRITLTTNSKLENLTFIVPIPIGNEALVNMAINESLRYCRISPKLHINFNTILVPTNKIPFQ